MRHSRDKRLCRFSMPARKLNRANAVVNDLNVLLPASVERFRLVYDNPIHKFLDHLSIEFPDVGVFSNQRQEMFGIKGFCLCGAHGPFQFVHTTRKLFLLGFVGSLQLLKSLIGYFPGHIVFVELLDDFVQRGNSGFGLFILFAAIF